MMLSVAIVDQTEILGPKWQDTHAHHGHIRAERTLYDDTGDRK